MNHLGFFSARPHLLFHFLRRGLRPRAYKRRRPAGLSGGRRNFCPRALEGVWVENGATVGVISRKVTTLKVFFCMEDDYSRPAQLTTQKKIPACGSKKTPDGSTYIKNSMWVVGFNLHKNVVYIEFENSFDIKATMFPILQRFSYGEISYSVIISRTLVLPRQRYKEQNLLLVMLIWKYRFSYIFMVYCMK